MRFPRLAPVLALFIAGSSLATPALAQTQTDDQRFQQAQQRFDNEMRVFRTEFDRYQQARSRGYRDPRGNYSDSRNDPSSVAVREIVTSRALGSIVAPG